MNPFEHSAARSDAKSRSRFRRTLKHQVRAEHQREMGEAVPRLDQANSLALEAKKSALANGASKKEAKAAAQAAFKEFMGTE